MTKASFVKDIFPLVLVSCTVAFFSQGILKSTLASFPHSFSSDVLRMESLSLPEGLNGEVEGAGVLLE